MTSLDPLSIVPAGAGTGKTHTIQTLLGEWISLGRVRPERIMAVTYTEAGATELRERISAHLLASGRIEDALRLPQAYITTIHGLGLRLLTEFAFQAGTSPKPRVLNDNEKNTLVGKALARTDKADSLVNDLAGYGYTFNEFTGKSSEQAFRDGLVGAVHLLRSIGVTTSDAVRRHCESAARRIEVRYRGGRSATNRPSRLKERVDSILQAFPSCLAEPYGKSAKARKEYLSDFRNLRFAAVPGALDRDWKTWQQLRKLRTTDRKSPPPQYLSLATEIKAEADRLVDHPGPLQHACGHLSALLAAGLDVLEHYDAAKRQAGLVDYTDMIAGAERLLREHPEVLETLASKIDCLVVDEFQDTNPLQFALLWQIKEAGVPMLVVGDLKQSIMEFQGADPRLLEALERNFRDKAQPLTRNWRSQPGLVRFVNALGPLLFGTGYVAVEPQREPSAMTPLELIRFRRRPRRDKHKTMAHSVGLRLKQLLDDPKQAVVDRETRVARRLRGSDIAVLCPTKTALAHYAQVLSGLGLRVNIPTGGWLASRPVQIACHALAYVANPTDRHAALYLAVTELGSLTLEQGLTHLLDSGRVEEPLLQKLGSRASGVQDRTVYALVADVLSALNLFDRVALWPDGEQARANLVRLLGEAEEFMSTSREALAEGGYHGDGLPTFQAWLAARAEDHDGQPEESVLDENAIAMRTWHGSKGLEWPVVAACYMDRKIEARLPRLDFQYRSFDNLSDILASVEVNYWPLFDAPEHNEGQLRQLRGDTETVAKRLLYVALTRARDKLILEWPEFLAGRGKAECYWRLPGDRWSLEADGRHLTVNGLRCPCEVFEGGSELPADWDASAKPRDSGLPVVGRLAIRHDTAPTGLTPDSVAASSLEGQDEAAPGRFLLHWRYGDGLDLDEGLSGADLGTYLHRCFEVLGSRPEVVGRLDEVTGVKVAASTAAKIARAVAQFEAWLRSQFAVKRVLREWPLLALGPNGTVISGTADLIVETEDGICLLDHKSDRVDDWSEVFSKYEAQLETYARALSQEGRTVLGVGLNLIRRGEVVWRAEPITRGIAPRRFARPRAARRGG